MDTWSGVTGTAEIFRLLQTIRTRVLNQDILVPGFGVDSGDALTTFR